MWVKLDDRFAGHPKVQAASLQARWMFVEALCWSGLYLTDGKIPRNALRALSGFHNCEDLAEELADIGLFDRVDRDFQIHDFLDFQRSKADWEQERERDRLKKQSQRQRDLERLRGQGDIPRDTPRDTPRESPGDNGGESPGTVPTEIRGRHQGTQSVTDSQSVSQSDTVSQSVPDRVKSSTDKHLRLKESTDTPTGLVARLLSACSRNGTITEAEAHRVVGHVSRFVDATRIDETIGYLGSLKNKPEYPRLLIHALRQRYPDILIPDVDVDVKSA